MINELFWAKIDTDNNNANAKNKFFFIFNNYYYKIVSNYKDIYLSELLGLFFLKNIQQIQEANAKIRGGI